MEISGWTRLIDSALPRDRRDGQGCGGGVITIGDSPRLLGVETDPTVQAWIGANGVATGGQGLVTVTRHPVLGGLSPGTELLDQFEATDHAVADTTGHYKATPLARWWDGAGPIGIRHSRYQKGQAIFFSESFSGGLGDPIADAIWTDSLNLLGGASVIPTVSAWGLLSLALLLAAATIVLRTRRRDAIGAER